MAANSLLASATQILCVMAYKGEPGTTAEIIARSLDTNPVVVRRILKSLERKGLVAIRQGKDGGVRLSRLPQDITLADIYKAVDGDNGIFALRENGNGKCLVNCTMVKLLPTVFEAANEAVAHSLRRSTLADLVRQVGE